jgi:hypothetical protein
MEIIIAAIIWSRIILVFLNIVKFDPIIVVWISKSKLQIWSGQLAA